MYNFHCRQSSLAATGTLTGKLSIWDVPTQTNRNTCQHTVSVILIMFICQWFLGELRSKISLANPQQKRQIFFCMSSNLKKNNCWFLLSSWQFGKSWVRFFWWGLNVNGLKWTYTIKTLSFIYIHLLYYREGW